MHFSIHEAFSMIFFIDALKRRTSEFDIVGHIFYRPKLFLSDLQISNKIAPVALINAERMKFYLKSSIAKINYTDNRFLSTTYESRIAHTSHLDRHSTIQQEVFNLSQSRNDRVRGRFIEYCNQGPFDEGKEGLFSF